MCITSYNDFLCVNVVFVYNVNGRALLFISFFFCFTQQNFGHIFECFEKSLLCSAKAAFI